MRFTLLPILKWVLLLFPLICLSIGDLDEAEARRRGYSSSRRSSRSASRSRRSSRSSTRRPTRRRGSGLSRSAYQPSRSQSSTRRSRSARKARPSTSSRSSRSARSPRRTSTSRYGRRSRSRYRTHGSWWRSRSTLKPRWRSAKRRWRFRSSFYERPRYARVWDPYFLATAATALFWYHHWDDHDIHEALYVDHVLPDDELHRLEGEVQTLRTQGITIDPDYLPEGVGPQDAYSKAYIDEVYREREESGSGLILLGSILGGLLLCFALFRRR